MRLRDLFFSVVIAVCLVATPVTVGTSLFKASYNFTELLEPSAEPFTWLKNPIEGEPIKNYLTGAHADIYHLVENIHHWDLAGEIVLDWTHKIVFPFAYFEDIFAGNFKVVLSPTTKKDSEEGDTIIVGRVHNEGAAKLAVVMLYAKLKGMSFMIEQDEIAPLKRISF